MCFACAVCGCVCRAFPLGECASEYPEELLLLEIDLGIARAGEDAADDL